MYAWNLLAICSKNITYIRLLVLVFILYQYDILHINRIELMEFTYLGSIDSLLDYSSFNSPELHNTLFLNLIFAIGAIWVIIFKDKNYYMEYIFACQKEQSIDIDILQGPNIVKMAKTGPISEADIELLNNTELWIKEAISELNNPNIRPIRVKILLSDITEEVGNFISLGGDINNLSLYSLIDNKLYFKIIKEEVLTNTNVELLEEIEDAFPESEEPEPKNEKGGSNSGDNGGTVLFIEDKSSSNNPSTSSSKMDRKEIEGESQNNNSSILNKILVGLLSLFSYVMDFLAEFFDNFFF